MANKIITVLESDGVTQTDIVSMDVGRQAAAASISHAWSTEDKAVADAIVTALGLLGTQTTSAAILAKLSADPATQTTLAAILAKLIAAPATEAKQDTGNTSLQLIDDTITAQNTALGSTKTSLAGGSVTTSAPTYTTGQINPLSLDTTGALRVNVTAGGAGGGAVTNAGTFAVQESGAALTSLQLLDDNIVSQGTALGTTKVNLNAGSVTTAAPTYTTGQVSPLSLDTSGALRVNVTAGGAGGGAVTNAGTFAVQPAGSVAHDGAGAGVNPVLAGGYASAAAPTDVSTDGDSVRAWRLRNGAAATVITAAGALVGGDATNGLDVDVTRLPALPAGTNNIGDVDVLTVPADPFGANADAASVTGSVSAKLRAIATALGATALDLGSGTGGSRTLRVFQDPGSQNSNGQTTKANSTPTVLASDDNAVVALELIDDAIKADDAAFTPGTTKVMMAGFQADEASTDSVDEGDAGAARMTLDRKIIVTNQPHTAGGLSVFRSLDLDETEEDVKTSAGCLYKLRATNRTTSVRYLKLYNATAANVTVGTTTPIDTIPLPANASDYTVLTESFGGLGLTFDTALSMAVTTGFADNDTGAPGANDVIVSAYYK